jgi:hypothetical protein
VCLSAAILSSCGPSTNTEQSAASAAESAMLDQLFRDVNPTSAEAGGTSTLSDLFVNNDDPNTTLEVNKYIWNASLQILDFMPIETVDPFSGVIVMGYGTPPGSGTAYRATVFVQDPALDARSLNLSMATRNGPVDGQTVRLVEDAILTRARELRLRDSNL